MVTKITRNSERWTKQHQRRILRRAVREPVRYGCNSVSSTNYQAAYSHRKCLFYGTSFASRVRAHQSGLYQRAEKINRTSRRNFKRNFKEHENKDRCQEISISKQFKCPFCCFQANTLREIKTHKSRHDQCKKRICPTCSREFHRLHSLRCHMDKCNDIKSKRLKCPWCEFVCSSRGEAEGHIRNHEETCKSYLCTVDTCTFWSKWLQSLRAHTKRQHAKMETESQENLVTDQAVMIPKKNQHCSLHQSTSGLMIDTKAQRLDNLKRNENLASVLSLIRTICFQSCHNRGQVSAIQGI